MMHPARIWAVGNGADVDVYIAWHNASHGGYLYKEVTERPVSLEEAKKIGKTFMRSRKKFLDLVLGANESALTELPDVSRIIIESWYPN